MHKSLAISAVYWHCMWNNTNGMDTFNIHSTEIGTYARNVQALQVLRRSELNGNTIQCAFCTPVCEKLLTSAVGGHHTK